MKIVIPEVILPAPLERLRAVHDVVYTPTLVDRPDELIVAVRDADCIIVRQRTQVRGPLLDAMTRCKVIGRLGVGLDNIDMETCKARGIKVVPAIGGNARSVAEYVMTASMMLMRGAYTSSRDVADGKWPRQTLGNGLEIYGRTFGVIGLGSIGQVTARLARNMGMRVIAHDRTLESDAAELKELDCELLPLDKVLENSDIISLHIPLTPETRGMIGAERFGRMKPGSVLINSSRGGIVDERALADALRAGRLRGAALDVFETEPLAAGSALAEAPNLLLTPHIAGATVDSEIRVCDMIVDRVLESLK